MLTPEDIDRQQFSKQFKGYAVEEVDDFLEELTNDYEVLMLANKKAPLKGVFFIGLHVVVLLFSLILLIAL